MYVVRREDRFLLATRSPSPVTREGSSVGGGALGSRSDTRDRCDSSCWSGKVGRVGEQGRKEEEKDGLLGVAANRSLGSNVKFTARQALPCHLGEGAAGTAL